MLVSVDELDETVEDELDCVEDDTFELLTEELTVSEDAVVLTEETEETADETTVVETVDELLLFSVLLSTLLILPVVSVVVD